VALARFLAQAFDGPQLRHGAREFGLRLGDVDLSVRLRTASSARCLAASAAASSRSARAPPYRPAP
jgi:hypothetical protein